MCAQASGNFEANIEFHSPRLCRVAVFLIQTNVSLGFIAVFFSKTHLSLSSAYTRVRTFIHKRLDHTGYLKTQ